MSEPRTPYNAGSGPAPVPGTGEDDNREFLESLAADYPGLIRPSSQQQAEHRHRLANLALAAFDCAEAATEADADRANTFALNTADNPAEYHRWADLVSKISQGLIVKLYQAVEYLEVTR